MKEDSFIRQCFRCSTWKWQIGFFSIKHCISSLTHLILVCGEETEKGSLTLEAFVVAKFCQADPEVPRPVLSLTQAGSAMCAIHTLLGPHEATKSEAVPLPLPFPQCQAHHIKHEEK